MNSIFIAAESITSNNLKRIAIRPEFFFEADDSYFYTKGSYAVLEARLFGLTYPGFLRFVRIEYDAILIGKQGYTIPYWRDEKQLNKIINELNRRWNLLQKYKKEKKNVNFS